MRFVFKSLGLNMWVTSLLFLYRLLLWISLLREICGSVSLGEHGHDTVLKILGFLASEIESSSYSVLCDDLVLQMSCI